MTKWTLIVFGISSFFLVGAKGNGCSTEYQPGDGRDEDWELGDVPEALGEDLPMTCEWLDGDNCWKQFARKVATCAPEESGTFDSDRSMCSFPDGSTLELAGPIGEPADGTTHFPIVNHRLLDADGDPCLTATILDVGHHAYDVRGEVYVGESLSLTTYRIICPDGTSYANDVEGTCDEFGIRWLFRDAPGYTLTCEGSSDRCEAVIWGTESDGGDLVLACTDSASHGAAGARSE